MRHIRPDKAPGQYSEEHDAHKTTVVAVFAATADAVLVALEVHPASIAGNPKAWGKATARYKN